MIYGQIFVKAVLLMKRVGENSLTIFMHIFLFDFQSHFEA